MKNLITIILSFLFISYSFSDTIKYREKKLFRAYKDKVVTDVEFLGVTKYGVCYQYPTKYLGNVLKTIKCEDVYEIVDDNDNKIDYSCSEFTYDPTIGVIDSTVIQQDKRNVGGLFIALAGVVGIISKSDKQPNFDQPDELKKWADRQDTYDYVSWGLLAIGGFTLLSDNKRIESISAKKTN